MWIVPLNINFSNISSSGFLFYLFRKDLELASSSTVHFWTGQETPCKHTLFNMAVSPRKNTPGLDYGCCFSINSKKWPFSTSCNNLSSIRMDRSRTSPLDPLIPLFLFLPSVFCQSTAFLSLQGSEMLWVTWCQTPLCHEFLGARHWTPGHWTSGELI